MPEFRQYYQTDIDIVNAALPGNISPRPDQVWEIVSVSMNLKQDNTTAGSRILQLKAQSPNQKYYLNDLLSVVGNDLTSAGTGVSDLYGRGSVTRISNLLGVSAANMPSVAQISGSLSVAIDFLQCPIMTQSQQFGMAGNLLGADKYDLLVYYIQYKAGEYWRFVH